MKRYFGVSLIAAVLLALAACSTSKPAPAPLAPALTDVAVRKAARTTVADSVEAVGTVRAHQTAQLGAQTMGNLVAVNAREGDRVRRGQVLAVIDPAQSQAAYDRATAGLSAAKQERIAADADSTLAQSTLKRYEKLFAEKSVTPQEIDEVRTRAAASRARRELAAAAEAQAIAAVTQAKTTLDYTSVRAPFDGVIASRLADIGTLVAPGTLIFVIEDVSGYRLEVTVDESALPLAKRGADVSVLISDDSTTHTARVVEIVPAADPDSRSFVVKLKLPAGAGVRSGMFGRAFFQRGTRQAITVPQNAVLYRGQLQALYVVTENGVADLRYVTLGQVLAGNVEVLSGVEPGERFVAAPGNRDLAGKHIEVR